LGIGTQLRSFFRNASFRADVGLGIVGSPSPDSDYWYHGLGYRTEAGPMVSPSTATRLAAVFSCTRVCAETVGSLPFGIYRERKGGGRDLAKDHPAYELFLKPNPWQTVMEFFEMMQVHLELRGNAYALKVSSSDRAIDQLIPLHPDRVRVYLLPNNRLRYEVTAYSSGQIDRYSQDEILHVRGTSYDGIMGISTVSAMAEVIGVGLAQQQHRARYFHNSAIPSLSVETVKMTDEAREQMVNSISEKFSGEGAFRVIAPPPGSKVTALGLTNKDSQLIEASQATRTEICGAWRVPPHKIGDLSKGTFSNIEQQNIEFGTDCVRPRVIRLERRLDVDIVDSLRAYESSMGDYYIVFNMDALFRGDLKSRYEAYSQSLTWQTRDEIRSSEGRNPISGQASELLVPVNMETMSQASARSFSKHGLEDDASEESSQGQDEQELGGDPETPQDGTDEITEENARAKRLRLARLKSIAMRAADRLVRREAKSLRNILSSERFERELEDLYVDLAPIVSETMAIPLASAKQYLEEHRRWLIGVYGASASSAQFARQMMLEFIENSAASRLAAIAVGARQDPAVVQ
jgi:HK97 family phage portal protein